MISNFLTDVRQTWLYYLKTQTRDELSDED